MGLLILDQITYFPAIFEPEYESGSHGVISPLTGALYGAYGLTIVDYEKRSAALIRLSDRTHTKGAAYYNKQKFVPVPAPDFVEDFPPEDTRGIIAIYVQSSELKLESGTDYDLTFEIALANKTPTDLILNLEVIDLTPDIGEVTTVLSQTNFMLLSATETTVLLAVKIPNTIIGQKIIQVNGTTELNFMVQPSECILDLQTINAPTTFYQVDGPETYNLSIGDPLDLAFTASNGIDGTELWEFDDSLFLQAHNLTFDDSGVLSSTGVTGPPGTYQVTVFVEQSTSLETKLFASRILEISVA